MKNAFNTIYMILSLISTLVYNVDNISLQRYNYFKQACSGKKLEGCLLSSSSEHSKLSCLKECQNIGKCKSVNILQVDVKRYLCELNSCFKEDCRNLSTTSSAYKYLYKAMPGKYKFLGQYNHVH